MVVFSKIGSVCAKQNSWAKICILSICMNITGRLICLLFLVRVERRERHDGAAQPIGTTCGWGNVHPTRRALFNFTKLCSKNKLL